MRPSYLAFLMTLFATPALADCEDMFTPGIEGVVTPTPQELEACAKIASDLRVQKVGVWVPGVVGDKRLVAFYAVATEDGTAVERESLAEDLCRVGDAKGATVYVYPQQLYRLAKFDLARLGEAEASFAKDGSERSGSKTCM